MENSGNIYEETLVKLIQDECENGADLEAIQNKFDKDYISDIMGGMVGISMEMQLSDYTNRIDEIIRSAEVETGQFLQDLNQKWNAGLSMSKGFSYICQDCICETAELQQDSGLKKALRQIFVSGCQVYYEIIILVTGGMADGAWARWRTLFELGTLSTFIWENGEEAASKFIKSSSNKDEYYQWAKELPIFLHYKKRYMSFKSIFDSCKNKKYTWFDCYKTASSTVHGCARGCFYSMGGDGTEKKNLGGELYGIDIPAIYSAESLCIIAQNYLLNFTELNCAVYARIINKWVKDLRNQYRPSNK